MAAQPIALLPHVHVDHEPLPLSWRRNGPGKGCLVTSANGDETLTEGV